jgi:hypothetical protein
VRQQTDVLTTQKKWKKKVDGGRTHTPNDVDDIHRTQKIKRRIAVEQKEKWRVQLKE